MFSHLHCHSCYSLLEGLPTPIELARRAAHWEMPALALTDHQGLVGAIEFYDACRDQGIQPVLGLELDVQPPFGLRSSAGPSSGRLVLLCTNLIGWGNLCRLSSAASKDPNTQHGVNFETLAVYSAGLICLTGGARGLCSRLMLHNQKDLARRWLEQLDELFPGSLYLELGIHTPEDRPLAQATAILAKSLDLPGVVAHSIDYLLPQEAPLQRTLSAIRTNTALDQLSQEACALSEAAFLSPTELSQRYHEFPEALARTNEVAERCRFELPLGKSRFPVLALDPGQTAAQVLRAEAHAGALRYYSDPDDAIHSTRLPPEVAQRLEHELYVIENLGYEALFLVMQQIVAFAREQGIPIASRGSASSSLVAHCLGITTPDPIRLNLYFERFLNPARARPPDIDTDLCSRRRDEVIRFVYRQFGHERVAMVCTINRFRRRSALRETAKAYGLPSQQISRLVDLLPSHWYAGPERFASTEDPYQSLAETFTEALYQQIFQDAAALIGAPRHLSIHPGGMIISPQPITDLVPTQTAAKGIVITQFDLESIERLGLVKIDLLGIRGLSVLGDVAEHLSAKRSSPADNLAKPIHRMRREAAHQESALAALESIPTTDPVTSALVEAGRTIGCFQIESTGMRHTLREIRARTIDDILAALALYRPGPLTGGLKKAFVARYRGLEPVVHLHPALEPLLKDTYGVILYQEQVLQIAHKLAGLSLTDSDLLRRAMSHFDPGKEMHTLKERFVTGVQTTSGVPRANAEQIWQLMAAFAGYGFPKAHAASYAWVAWQSAWCKAHYPAVFMAAVLANWGGYYSQRIYLTEARRLGLAVYPPLVNFAADEFSVCSIDGKTALVMGLNQVSELTRRTRQRIQSGRPFHSLNDFLARADPRPIEAENLARAGCLEGMGAIPDLLLRLTIGGWRGGQLSLFDTSSSAGVDWSIDEKARAQEAILGVGVTAHLLERHAVRIAQSGTTNILEAAGRIGERFQVVGTRQTWRRNRTRDGEVVYLMVLEDLEAMIDVVITKQVYAHSREALRSSGPYWIEGIVEFNDDLSEPFLRAEKIALL